MKPMITGLNLQDLGAVLPKDHPISQDLEQIEAALNDFDFGENRSVEGLIAFIQENIGVSGTLLDLKAYENSLDIRENAWKLEALASVEMFMETKPANTRVVEALNVFSTEFAKLSIAHFAQRDRSRK
jgi:hypothetical protein